MRETIFIVDDEEHIRNLLLLGLAKHGFLVRTFESGSAFLSMLAEMIPDAVVLDWMMPPPDGEELCKKLRQDARTQNIPILMLTARTSESDCVHGLDMGADDYLTKPFSIKELAARLRALLRRGKYIGVTEGQPTPAQRIWFNCGELSLDIAARRVYAAGRPLQLTMREFNLLHALLKNRGMVLTRELLLDTVWRQEYTGDTRTVDVHIRYLRQKLAGCKGVRIETVRGLGYKLCSNEEAAAFLAPKRV